MSSKNIEGRVKNFRSTEESANNISGKQFVYGGLAALAIAASAGWLGVANYSQLVKENSNKLPQSSYIDLADTAYKAPKKFMENETYFEGTIFDSRENGGGLDLVMQIDGEYVWGRKEISFFENILGKKEEINDLTRSEKTVGFYARGSRIENIGNSRNHLHFDVDRIEVLE